jgi:UDP-glucose 4,6-dehydratase|tara:strand:- start:1535 stop:2584 length:1050 start_codon:yes stop_codon:yes gene_type:complete
MNDGSEIKPVSRVLIIGKGFIGTQLSNFLSQDEDIEVHSIANEQVNYLDSVELNSFLDSYLGENIHFDTVINCSGVTGERNVDDVENDKELAYLYNAVLPSVIAGACVNFDINNFINISSGCIFTGPKEDGTGYTETDIPNFGMFNDESSWYSKTKHAGELNLTSVFNTYNLRIRMPIGEIYHPRNTILKMARYKNILNSDNSVTYLYDLFNFVYNLILTNQPFTENQMPYGIYNIVSNGTFNPKMLFEAFNNNKEELLEADILPKGWDIKNIKFLDESQFKKNKVTKVGRSVCIMDNTLASNLDIHKFADINQEFIDKLVKNIVLDKKNQESTVVQTEFSDPEPTEDI